MEQDETKKIDFMIYIRLAFEYGVVLTETARNLNMEVNSDLVKRMEEVINGEFPGHTPEYLGVHMIPLIMAALQPVDKKVDLKFSNHINKTMASTKKGGMKGGMKGGKGGKKGC